MKSTLALSAVLALLLAACSSEPTKTEAPKVDEVKVVPPAPMKKPEMAKPDTVAPAKPLEEAKMDDGVFPPKDAPGALGKRAIYYAFDTYTVEDEYKPIASAHGGFLSKHAKAKLIVQGNCDERGSREYNLALGMRRAEGVKTMMNLAGGAPEQIEAVSFGKEKPKAEGHDEAAWSQNRRVDIVYQGE